MVEWISKHITIDVLTLIVAIATLVVAVCTLLYTRNRDKKHLKSQLKRKRAQLEVMESSLRAGFNIHEIGSLNGNMAALRADIEQLEEEL